MIKNMQKPPWMVMSMLLACLVAIACKPQESSIAKPHRASTQRDIMILQKGLGSPMPPGIQVMRVCDSQTINEPCLMPFAIYQISGSNDAVKQLADLGSVMKNKGTYPLRSEEIAGFSIMLDVSLPPVDVEDWYKKPEVEVYRFTLNKLIVDKSKVPWAVYFSLGPTLEEEFRKKAN